nr:MAG TPA: hypothetical protein [Bacteriophage sp.]DAM96531.1 MAG TPA: hypothetical protein [Caudoviricetes sp.]DAN03636.1 MAG TPA: hypothetical protein [Caudoviricetes sp.]
MLRGKNGKCGKIVSRKQYDIYSMDLHNPAQAILFQYLLHTSFQMSCAQP